MGTTYSNCQVRTDSQESVIAALTPLLKEPTYVAPAVNGWVGVYPEGERTDPDALAKKLSAKLACGVLTWMVHDNDVFAYSLFENGKLRDIFNSCPDYFEPVSKAKMNRLRGKPEALVPYCISGVGSAQVLEVLHPAQAPEAAKNWIEFSSVSDDQYLSADIQASALAKLLGIEWELSVLDYRQNQRGNLDAYFEKKFVFIGEEKLSPRNLQKNLWELPMQAVEIKSAIETGADVNAITEFGEPFLVLAAFNGAAEVVQLLLDAGANVNASTTKANKDSGWERGVNALMAAVSGGANAEMGDEAANTSPQIETVQILISMGADVNAKTDKGRTALGIAQEELERFSSRKSDRWYSEEVLAECVTRNTKLLEILRAAGAVE